MAHKPSPFKAQTAQQAERVSGQQAMEAAAVDEEFDKALAQANDLGGKVDTYTAAIAELTRLQQEYEQALAEVLPNLQAAAQPNTVDAPAGRLATHNPGQTPTAPRAGRRGQPSPGPRWMASGSAVMRVDGVPGPGPSNFGGGSVAGSGNARDPTINAARINGI